MDLVLLSAGFATRLEPLTLDQPKHLLPIKKGKFIDLLIDQLLPVEKKFDRKYIVTNDRYFDNFNRWVESSRFKVEIINDGVKNKEDRLGSAGDLLYVLNQKKIDNDVLVLASDFVFSNFNFDQFFKFIKEKDTSAIVVRHENNKEELQAGSCLRLDKDLRVTKFEEKPKIPFSNLYGIPYYFIKKEDLPIVRKLDKALWDNCGQLAAIIAQDGVLSGFLWDENILHMTTLADYEKIKKLDL